MSARSWIDILKSHFLRTLNRQERRASRRRGPTARGLKVESLEDRRVLAFAAPVNYGVEAYPQAVVAADFNNDAVLDLAVANSSSSNVSVLLGNADGTFQPAVNSATGSGPFSLAVGDFNADGKLDLATVGGDVSVLLGNADGTFQAATSIGVAGPTSVAVGDINADGKLDLVATTNAFTCDYYGYYGGCYGGHYTGSVNVLLGNGDGTFAAPTAQILDGSYLTSAVLQDFNADGTLDLATTDSYSSRVRVLAGNGDGTFGAPADYTTGYYPQSVAVGDVNGDGISDLVTRNSSNLSVLVGNGTAGVGDGTFQPAQNTSLNFYPTSLAVGDINADGKLDLVATSNAFTCTYYGYYGGCYDGFYTGQVKVLLGHGNGTFASPTDHVLDAGTYASGVAVGDFNGGGFPDVAVTDSNTNNVSVLINDQFWPPPPPPTVSINDVEVSEGNTGTTEMTFTIYLSAASGEDITVHYETADGSAIAGSDYTGDSGDVTIPAGDTSYLVTIDVTVDRVWEPTETFAVNLSAPVNATIGDGQGIGTIYDDEPLISIDNATVTEATGTSSVNATFTVSLSDTSDVDVTVHYVLANGNATAGDDFTGGSGDVTIPAGQYSQTFTVAVLGDRIAEPTETYVVNLTAPVNAGIADNQGVGTILDNEPRLSINNVGKREGNGHTTQILFTVTLSAAYDQAVTVNYATADGTATAGSDYEAKSGTLTFAPGVTSMTITIVIIPDKVKEANETFFVNLSGASSNALIFDALGIGTIIDDDTRGKK